jgi:hypothetical protein
MVTPAHQATQRSAMFARPGGGSVAVRRSAMMCATKTTAENSMKMLNPVEAQVLEGLHYPLDVILTCVR